MKTKSVYLFSLFQQKQIDINKHGVPLTRYVDAGFSTLVTTLQFYSLRDARQISKSLDVTLPLTWECCSSCQGDVPTQNETEPLAVTPILGVSAVLVPFFPPISDEHRAIVWHLKLQRHLALWHSVSLNLFKLKVILPSAGHIRAQHLWARLWLPCDSHLLSADEWVSGESCRGAWLVSG